MDVRALTQNPQNQRDSIFHKHRHAWINRQRRDHSPLPLTTASISLCRESFGVELALTLDPPTMSINEAASPQAEEKKRMQCKIDDNDLLLLQNLDTNFDQTFPRHRIEQ